MLGGLQQAHRAPRIHLFVLFLLARTLDPSNRPAPFAGRFVGTRRSELANERDEKDARMSGRKKEGGGGDSPPLPSQQRCGRVICVA